MKQAFQPIPHTVMMQRSANGYACFKQAIMEMNQIILFMVEKKVIELSKGHL